MGKHAEDLAERRKKKDEAQRDAPHTHCDDWMAEIDACLEENAWHLPDD